MSPDEIRRSWDDDDTPRSVFPEPLAERLTREVKELRAEKERQRGYARQYHTLAESGRVRAEMAEEKLTAAMAEVERLRGEARDHALANGGCVPKPAYDDLAEHVRFALGRPNCPVCGNGEDGCCVCQQMIRAESAEARLDALVADLRGLADDLEHGRWLFDPDRDVALRGIRYRIGAVLDKHAGEQP